MNDVLQNLVTRRSVRAFRPEQIKDSELEAVLNAGLYAPSGMNRQSAIMLVIQDKPLIDKLSAMNARHMGTDSDPFYGAPTVVVVLADSRERNYLQDGSLVMGNLLNAAHSLGLGSCWINRAREVFDEPEGRAILRENGIGDEYVGIGNCILGYSAVPLPEAKPRREGRIFKIK